MERRKGSQTYFFIEIFMRRLTMDVFSACLSDLKQRRPRFTRLSKPLTEQRKLWASLYFHVGSIIGHQIFFPSLGRAGLSRSCPTTCMAATSSSLAPSTVRGSSP